jgi:hypothetical protein
MIEMMEKSPNMQSFFKWLFSNKDNFDQIAFIFYSQRNWNNARFVPLFSKSEDIKLVYFSGFKIRQLDRICLIIFRFLTKLPKKKINRYRIVHAFNFSKSFKPKNLVVHIDDPTYTQEEIEKAKSWEKYCSKNGIESFIITTNQFTVNYFRKYLSKTHILIIEQGYHDIQTVKFDKKIFFSCVYSSPFIHYGSDKHSNHSTWSANLLIEKIIPDLLEKDEGIVIELIGEVGRDAYSILSSFPNVYLHGQVGSEKNLEIISNCDLALYPRLIDHKRSILKIFTYVGAGIPVLSFDLVDTKVVKQHKLGFIVKSSDEFISKIIFLKNNPHLLHKIQENVINFRPNYSWNKLARKLDDFMLDLSIR